MLSNAKKQIIQILSSTNQNRSFIISALRSKRNFDVESHFPFSRGRKTRALVLSACLNADPRAHAGSLLHARTIFLFRDQVPFKGKVSKSLVPVLRNQLVEIEVLSTGMFPGRSRAVLSGDHPRDKQVVGSHSPHSQLPRNEQLDAVSFEPIVLIQRPGRGPTKRVESKQHHLGTGPQCFTRDLPQLGLHLPDVNRHVTDGCKPR